ncbi:MAG: AsnC family transcriptional regulator [Chlorobi bacterium]|nr:AsnC family transcriptional regulator [Chlorobiota bacterium]
MEKLQIDHLDGKILQILQQDARTPYLEIARQCKVSGAAIHQRMKSLQRRGFIRGAVILLDPHKLGYQTCAYIGIYLEEAKLFGAVVEQLKQIPEITQCHYTTGMYSIFIKVYTRDNDHLKTVLAEKLQSIPGIARTETFISLEESFSRQIPVPMTENKGR